MRALKTRIKALEVKSNKNTALAVLTEYEGIYTLKHHGNEHIFDSLHDYQQFYKSIPDQPRVLHIERVSIKH